jgi:microcystin-dependent protein
MSGLQEPVVGYLLCNGTAVSRATYSDLFGVVGTAYGAGDGSTTFNLPNIQGKFPLGAQSATAGSSGGRGFSGGSSTHGHTVTITAHTHTVNSHNHTVTSHTHTIGAHVHPINAHSHFISGTTDAAPTALSVIASGSTASPSSLSHTHTWSGFTDAPAVNTGNNADFASGGSGVLTTSSTTPLTNSSGSSTLTAGAGVSIIDHTPTYQIANFLIKY